MSTGGMAKHDKNSKKVVKEGKERIRNYKHSKHSRKNNPTEESSKYMEDADTKPISYHPPLRTGGGEPRLAWMRDPSLDKPTTEATPIYIHEKMHPAAFIESLRKDGNIEQFFGDYDGLPKESDYSWYQYDGNWQNRIIHGESRNVMASLLAKELMVGTIQMIYYDPPYGIDFEKILQANIDKSKNSKDIPNDLAHLKTFRDAYKNGIHSYLDNVYDIALHARALLTMSGSFFLQIGFENMHKIAMILDEVFGEENHIATITVKTTGNTSSDKLPQVSNYILWYAKDKAVSKYNQLYEELDTAGILELMNWNAMIEEENGSTRTLTDAERKNMIFPPNTRLFQQMPLSSDGYSKERSKPYEWNGVVYKCRPDKQWRISYEGLDRLGALNRLDGTVNNVLWWKRYGDEIPGKKLNNMWNKKASSQDKHYVVETAYTIIEKCILMTTDPGDVVYDPTCGSGTTAYVAEKWGRRWITSDAGLVAINLTRQRLTTGIFPYYLLIDSLDGYDMENKLLDEYGEDKLKFHNSFKNDPSEGFVYKRIPQVSPKYLAYKNLKTPIIPLVNRPYEKKSIKRVSSPFTVESHSPFRYVDRNTVLTGGHLKIRTDMIEALKISGIQMEDKIVQLKNIEEYSGELVTHTALFEEKKSAIMMAHDDCTVSSVLITRAADEAVLMPGINTLIIIAFEYETGATSEKRGKLSIHRAQAALDMKIGNLKNRKEDQSFVMIGEPEIEVYRNKDEISVKVVGYNTYDPATGSVSTGKEEKIFMYMIDTNYDGKSFLARRIHFSKSIDKQVQKFRKELSKHIDEKLWEYVTSSQSASFPRPKDNLIAVKIITKTHTEMTTVINLKKIEIKSLK